MNEFIGYLQNFVNDIDVLRHPEINYTAEIGCELVTESRINRL